MGKRPPRNLTAPSTVEAKLRAAKALELRMEGKTFDEIAEEMGYAGRQGAYNVVKAAIDAITREPAEALVRLDLERLDKMWGIHYLNAQAGDPVALGSCLKIMERRARLLGLDVQAINAEQPPPPPTKVVIEVQQSAIEPDGAAG